MSELNVSFSHIKGRDTLVIVTLSGAIDASTVNIFQSRLQQLHKDGINEVILDMRGIKYVNSTGLGSLVKYADTFRAAGGGIVLASIPQKVKIVIEMLGLHEFFDIALTTEKAVALYKVEKPPVVEEEAAPVDILEQLGVGRSKPASGREMAEEVIEEAERRQVTDTYPMIIDCERCSVGIEIERTGDFICPRCRATIHADAAGIVRFAAPARLAPIQMTLLTDKECTDSFLTFVYTYLTRKALPQELVTDFVKALQSVCASIATEAYESNSATYNVMFLFSDNMVTLKLSDHGRGLDYDMLAEGVEFFDELNLAAHPSGGNLISISKKI